MSSPGEYSFKGAALAKSERESAALAAAAHSPTAATNESDQQRYKWMRATTDPGEYGVSKHYFVHQETNESRWEEPDEPFWIFNAVLQAADPEYGLQQPGQTGSPKKIEAAPESVEPTSPKDPLEGYTGYNPKIHGNYDPNADYAQWHKKKRDEENGVVAPVTLPPGYGAEMILNARTGHAQGHRPGADHHNDAAKSGRQLNAYFDADAAANAHEGRSLREERQKQALSKKQVAEFKQKKADRKKKKEMDFYRS